MKCLLVTRFRSHSTAISAVRVSGSSRICSSTAPFTLDSLRMPVPTAERLAGRNLLPLNSLSYEFVFFRLKGNLKKHLKTHVSTKEELEDAWRPFARYGSSHFYYQLFLQSFFKIMHLSH